MKIFLTGSTSYLGSKFIEMYGSKYDILGVSMHDPVNPVDLSDKTKLAKIYQGFKPDIIIHLAADIGRDFTTIDKIIETNPAIVQNLIDLALPNKTPFVFTSSEAVYGGKWDEGDYKENDSLEPRNPYGKSKAASERLLINSGLPYLITRGHRYVGIWSPSFNKKKQFPDTIKELATCNEIRLDSKKIFSPVLINNICDIFDHYITNDSDKQILINIGVDKKTTYYDLIQDISEKLDFGRELILPDGDEEGWPQNSSLNVEKAAKLGYPTVTYEKMLDIITTEFSNI